MAYPPALAELSPLDRALLQLHITRDEISAAPQITPQLRAISRTLKRAGQPKITTRTIGDVEVRTHHRAPYAPGTNLETAWPHYLASSDHPDAKKVLLIFNGLSAHLRYNDPLHVRGRLVKTLRLPIEAFCVAAGVSPLSILGVLTGEIVRMGAQASSVIAAINHPRVVQKSVEMALTDGGVADRMVLHRATGFLPSPKGAQTNISVQTTASAAATAEPQIAVVAPPPEQTIRRLVDRFNEARGLPPATTEPLRIAPAPPPEAITYAQATAGDHSQMTEIVMAPESDEDDDEI